MREGLRSGDEQTRADSRKSAAALASGIIALMNKTHSYGTRTGNAYIDGLIEAFLERQESVRRAFGGLTKFFEASSPPGPESPMHLIDKWGYAAGEQYPLNMAKALAASKNLVRRQLDGYADLMGGASSGPGGPGFRGAGLSAIGGMSPLRVEHRHTIDGASAANLAAAGVDPREFARGLAEASTDASGLFDHLRGLQSMSGS
jgi:hypothetical protein